MPPNAAWITQVCRTLKKRRTTLRKKLLQGTLLPELRKQVSQRFVDLPSVDLDGLLLLLDQGALVSIGEEVLAKQTDAGSAAREYVTVHLNGLRKKLKQALRAFDAPATGPSVSQFIASYPTKLDATRLSPAPAPARVPAAPVPAPAPIEEFRRPSTALRAQPEGTPTAPGRPRRIIRMNQ